MEINVTIMSGAGNIFSVIDNRNLNLDNSIYSKISSFICKESNIKTEGLLVINSGNNSYAFYSDFFNPDGSQGMMCGNGGRCAVLFASHNKFLNDYSNGSNIHFKMAGNEYSANFTSNGVRLYLPPPIENRTNIKLEVNNSVIFADYINVGTDHIVINKNSVESLKNTNIEEFDFENFAKPIRYHSIFEPKGVNVNLYALKSNNEIILRTFERGVEAETGACGTGAISTALSVLSKGKVITPVSVITRSNYTLVIDIIGKFPNNIQKIILEGKAEIINNYSVNISDNLMN